jgi:hypothetical protein
MHMHAACLLIYCAKKQNSRFCASEKMVIFLHGITCPARQLNTLFLVD